MPDATPRTLAPRIPVRAPRFGLDALEPGWSTRWIGDDPTASHLVNALSLIFPEGERFFIRSVKHYAERYAEDPELLAEVRGFFGQEGRHGHEHERFNRLLAEEGYDVERFLAFYRSLAYDRIEKATPPHLRLATTVALEHMTSTLAVVALRTSILDEADPALRPLLYWHAVEEIEHRAVTWKVLAKVDPSVRTRVLGLAIATAVLLLFWGRAFQLLSGGRVGRVRGAFRRGLRQATPIVVRQLIAFVQPDFDPRHALDGLDEGELLRDGLARAGVSAG